MPFSKTEETVITSLSQIDQSKLIETIIEFSKSAWDSVIDSQAVNRWLCNYTGEFFGSRIAEQNLMLWILQHYVYYTDNDVRSMIANVWWKYINYQLSTLIQRGIMSECSPEAKIEYIKKKTIIQPLGNCSGSGTNISYFMRQVNGLPSIMFNLTSESDYQYLVLVDDVTISGCQAREGLDYYKTIQDKTIFVLTLISTNNAKKMISDRATVISSIELDETDLCFKEKSNIFSQKPEWRSLAKKLCRHYGAKLNNHNPLGFKSGQQLFSFCYNTPNNTLPVFWATINEWQPLFTRFFVEERRSTEGLCDEKFY